MFYLRNFLLLFSLIHAFNLHAYFIQEKISDDLYFVLEKLTPETVAHWQKLSELNKIKVDALEQKKRNEINQGFRVFVEALSTFEEYSNDIIAWVAYISDRPRQENENAQFDDIEMAVTVSTGHNSWFYSPIGISRWLGNVTRHPNISVPFLAFIGSEFKKHYPGLEYMVTSPADSLFNILKKSISPEYFYYFYNGTYSYKYPDDKSKAFWASKKLPNLLNEDPNFFFFSRMRAQHYNLQNTIAIDISYLESLRESFRASSK